MKKLGRNASLCSVIYGFFLLWHWVFFHAVGVFISWLNTCSNSRTQLPQTRSLCWVIFGGDGSSEEVRKVIHPLWGEKRLYPVDYCCLVPSPHHSHRAEKADAVILWHPFLQSWTESLLISWEEGTVCELRELLHPFSFFTKALVCVVLGGQGVEQTQNRLSSSVMPL